MRDRDWPAPGDLLPEQRHHAASASQHVAKADSDIGQAAPERGGLHQQLGDALGRAHHTGGIHRLVGRDENKALDTMGLRKPQQVGCSFHIIGYGFSDIHLHQRHVFVRRSVEDGVWLVGVEHLAEAVEVPHVGDDLLEFQSGPLPPQLIGNGKDAVLAMPHQYQRLRIAARDLAAQLAADGAPGPGHHHAAATQHLANGSDIGLHRLAAQQVFDVHVTELAHADPTGQDVVEPRDSSRGDSGSAANRQDVANCRAMRRGHGDDHLRYRVLVHQMRDIVTPAEHWHSGDADTMLGAIIVHETDRLEA